MRKYSAILLGGFWIVYLSGCVIFSGLQHKAELRYSDNLSAREVWKVGNFEDIFSQYWGLRFSGDAETVFQMEAPFFQEMIPLKRYENYIKGNQKNELLFIHIDGVVQETQGLYKVFLKIHLKLPDGNTREVENVDHWIWVRNNWYHVLKDYFIFPEISR